MMMMNNKNIFISLAKYCQSEENYFTSCLAYILTTETNFRNNLLKLFGLETKGFNFEAKSQAPYHKSYIDIELNLTSRTKEIKVLIEAKLPSLQGEGQLRKYLNISKRLSAGNNKKAYLIYLSFPGEKLDDQILNDNHFKGHFFWNQIYEECFKNSKSNLAKQFKEFMEAKGMGSLKPITKKEAESWGAFIPLKSKLDQYLQDLKKDKELKNLIGGALKTHQDKNRDDFSETFAFGYEIKTGITVYFGFFGLEENEKYANYNPGVYCSVYLYVNNITSRKNFILDRFKSAEEASPGELYRDTNHCLLYDKRLDKLIDFKSSKEKQLKMLKKFFKKTITIIKSTPEYRKLMKK